MYEQSILFCLSVSQICLYIFYYIKLQYVVIHHWTVIGRKLLFKL